MLQYSKETKQGFGAVENWETKIPVDANLAYGHKVVTAKFINSILTGNVDLIAYGWEGLNPVMLANGIMLSSFENRAVEFPLDGAPFEAKLAELIATSNFKKNVNADVKVDFEKSYAKK